MLGNYFCLPFQQSLGTVVGLETGSGEAWDAALHHLLLMLSDLACLVQTLYSNTFNALCGKYHVGI